MEESDRESWLDSTDSNQERQRVPNSPYYFGQINSTLPDRVRLKNLSEKIDAMLKTLAKMKEELKVKRNRRRRAAQKIQTKKRKNNEDRKEWLDHRPNKITRRPKKIPAPKNTNEGRYLMSKTRKE